MQSKSLFLQFFFTLTSLFNLNNILSSKLDNNRELILKLNRIGAIKMEPITLEGGTVSPFYFDMRLLISYPDVMEDFKNKIHEKIKSLDYKIVCGVPYAAVPMATLVSSATKTPMIMQRKEAKSYGTKKMLEGHFNLNDKCLIIEDVVVTGKSIRTSAQVLKEHDLIVKDVVILIDREQGGVQGLEKDGFNVNVVIKLSEVLEVLSSENLITQEQVDIIKTFCRENRV